MITEACLADHGTRDLRGCQNISEIKIFSRNITTERCWQLRKKDVNCSNVFIVCLLGEKRACLMSETFQYRYAILDIPNKPDTGEDPAEGLRVSGKPLFRISNLANEVYLSNWFLKETAAGHYSTCVIESTSPTSAIRTHKIPAEALVLFYIVCNWSLLIKDDFPSILRTLNFCCCFDSCTEVVTSEFNHHFG